MQGVHSNPLRCLEETVLVNMALEMPLDADSYCANLGVESHHTV